MRFWDFYLPLRSTLGWLWLQIRYFKNKHKKEKVLAEYGGYYSLVGQNLILNIGLGIIILFGLVLVLGAILGLFREITGW